MAVRNKPNWNVLCRHASYQTTGQINAHEVTKPATAFLHNKCKKIRFHQCPSTATTQYWYAWQM